MTFIAARENTVYLVETSTQKFALRAHRKGYRTDVELSSELDWMAELQRAGLMVPNPVHSLTNAYLQKVDDVQVDVLTWLKGQTLDALLPCMTPTQRADTFFRLGQTMAKLHEASDRWAGAPTCERPSWDIDGLLGERPLWDQFWENPHLNETQKSLFIAFRQRARKDLDCLSGSLDYGLIHADLVPSNILLRDQDLQIIDFDDGGFGFRLFELATVHLKQRSSADYPKLATAMLQGYRTHRFIDTRVMPLFMALRAATYVGWNITRKHEDVTGERNKRFISQAEGFIAAYLDGESSCKTWGT